MTKFKTNLLSKFFQNEIEERSLSTALRFTSKKKAKSTRRKKARSRKLFGLI